LSRGVCARWKVDAATANGRGGENGAASAASGKSPRTKMGSIRDRASSSPGGRAPSLGLDRGRAASIPRRVTIVTSRIDCSGAASLLFFFFFFFFKKC
jgi:hypothetical protein